MKNSISHLQPKNGEDDTIIWLYSADGMFRTNTSMNAAMEIQKLCGDLNHFGKGKKKEE